MTPAEQAKVDRVEKDRRERELLMLVLLLSLVGTARRFAGNAIRLGADPAQAIRNVLHGNPRLHLPGGGAKVASLMASAHLAGWKRAAGYAGNDADAPEYDDVFPIYRSGQAKVTADTILTGISESLIKLLTVTLAANASERTPVQVRRVNEAFTRYGWTSDSPGGVDPSTKAPAGYAAASAATNGILEAYNDGFWGGVMGGDSSYPLQHFTIIDERTTEICECRDGFTRPKNDPYWMTNWPKLHWNCRSIVLPVSHKTPLSEIYPSIPPMPGFGLAPIFA